MATSYSEKLRDPRWQKKRLEVLQRDSFTCKFCKDTATELHIHHQKYSGNPWQADLCHLITLCKHCHGVVENIKKTVGKDFEVFGIKKSLVNEGVKQYQLYVLGINNKWVEFVLIYGYENETLELKAFIKLSELDEFLSINRLTPFKNG